MKVVEFKSIVYFGKNFPIIDVLKSDFKTFPNVKVFSTHNPDELDQILRQSQLSAILINDVADFSKIENIDLLHKKESGIRVYCLDLNGSLTREEIIRLSGKKVTTLIKISKDDLKKKLEMFLLSKLKIFGQESEKIPTDSSLGKPVYFTHFKSIENNWGLVVSTHEQEKNIETLFNRSWSMYCWELISRADSISELENDPDFCEAFHGIIFPHLGQKALSLIHIKKDEKNFQDLYQKALEFLTKI
jgi:hypothetical protein